MSGLPLNVPPWSPYSKQLTGPEAIRAASGTPPPAVAWPRGAGGGADPGVWRAKGGPVPPEPGGDRGGDGGGPPPFRRRGGRLKMVAPGGKAPRLALDRLDHHRHCAGGDRR